MSHKLEPFQREGAEWLADTGVGLLADGMGLGKTPQAIHAADMVGARRVLVSCPALGRRMWKAQFDKWSAWRPEVFVESYDKIATNPKLRKQIRAWAPDVVIMDESHYLINPSAKRTRALYGAHCRGKGLASLGRYVWPMSGTPVPTHAGNVFPMLRALFPEKLTESTSTYQGFIDRYCAIEHTDYGPRIRGNRNAPELRKILNSVMLRRTAEVWTGPPIHWQDPVLLDGEAIAEEVRRLEAHEDFAPIRRVIEAAAKDETRSLWRDEESIAWAAVRRLTAQAKAGAIAALLGEELAAGAYEKIVVFGQHRAALAKVALDLAPHGVVTIVGGQTDAQRARAETAFQNDPAVRVCAVQIDAGHHTITLTAANHVAFIEQSLTPDINVQAAKRAHRYGQTRPVFVRPFALAGSIDEDVTQITTRKARDILQLIGN